MISEAKRTQMQERMAKLQIYESDLEEKFIRSSGAGGQNVNKVSTCVYLKHLPSGQEVKCQKTRSQLENRYWARRILCDRIEAIIFGKKSEEQQKREKIRRQKRKRSKRAKEKMLNDKRHHSQKKQSRNWDKP